MSRNVGERYYGDPDDTGSSSTRPRGQGQSSHSSGSSSRYYSSRQHEQLQQGYSERDGGGSRHRYYEKQDDRDSYSRSVRRRDDYGDGNHYEKRRTEKPDEKYNPFSDNNDSSGSSEDDREHRRKKSVPVNINNFDISQFKSLFDRMFFRSTDLIRPGSPSYVDFWKFYDKIQAMRQKSGKPTPPTAADAGKAQPELSESSSRRLVLKGGVTVPEKYSKKDTVPFTLKDTDPNEYVLRLNPDDQEYIRSCVPSEVIQNFIEIITYFLDFSQKERFTKLKKLRQAQSTLPIAQFSSAIVDFLEKSNVLIIAGDTGCGKSTQVPQYLVKAGYTNIACTQPRRIACLSLCKRVAYETLNEYGSEIGYQIRFEKHKTQHTKVVFITEGLLLRQVSTDSLLSSYNVLVLDEVHERHLHGDFLLGIVKCLLYQRTDIKIVLMSATINTEMFQDYFQGLAPILQVPGRLFPIKVQYRPVSIEELNSKSSRINPGPYVRILQLIDDKFPHDERGDVLIFLSGLNEITTVQEATQLYADQTKRWIILLLHSSLSIDDQDKVFDYPPEGVRKCIISTNIAETSITIDGIRFVVDSGKVKEMAYDPNCKMQRLKEFWISKASAEQRKGRAGRTGPGVCYRLYAESDYNDMQPYSTPEIQRVPLDSLLLQMISIGIRDVRKFPFIEPPTMESIESSMLRLSEQNVVTVQEQLTPIGQTLAQLPVDVTIGKMLIMGTVFDQIDAVLSLAAALSVQSPFTNWAHRNPDCVAARKSLDSDHGDPFTLLNAYRAWLEEKAASTSTHSTKKWCKRRGFEEQRFYEMTKLRQQFKTLLKDSYLIQDNFDPAAMSSSERSQRYGEIKQLRTLKREYQMAAPRKKKILKINQDGIDPADMSGDDDGGGGGGGTNEDGSIDIRDVEFRLRHDSKQVKDLLNESTAHGNEDLTMLKIILCSGLYPQLAVADDFNKYKSDSEQVYHTRGKGFTVLHPMSVFANQPDVLRLADSDVVLLPQMATKLSISSRHQMICFLNLLETNKPYLMNTFRVPAVQTLFLFAHNIDSDPSFTRFICDSWLEVEFPDSVSARLVVGTVIELRDMWNQLLAQRLAQKDDRMSTIDLRPGRLLSRNLISFLRCEVFYTIKRLLAADLKDIYSREELSIPVEEDMLEAKLETGFRIGRNIAKGGLSLTSYLTYGCLYGELPDPENWECPTCEVTIMGNPLECLLHQCKCKKEVQKNSANSRHHEELKARPFAKLFHCPVCDKDLHLTPVEILRHKKEHSTA